MKRKMAVISVFVMLIMLLLANFALAGGNGSSVKNDVDVDVKQGQESNNLNVMKGGQQEFSVQSTDNSRSIGILPETYTHGIGTAVFPLNEYGHLPTQFSLKTSVMVIRKLTGRNFQTFKEINDRKGSEEWEDINEKIIPSPVIINAYPNLSETDYVYYLDPESIKSLLPRIRSEQVVGLILYNSKLDKKHPVLPVHLQMRSLIDSIETGANICIPVDQFFQGYFVPEGYEFSVSGIFSWIFGGLRSGGAVSPHAGIAKQQNTEFGIAGAAFLLIHVDNPEEFLYPPVQVLVVPPPPPPVVEKPKEPEKLPCDAEKIRRDIKTKQSEIEACHVPSYNNLLKRGELGTLYERLYICTKDERYLSSEQFGESKYEIGAIGQFEVAERDYQNGIDINNKKDPKKNVNKDKADRVLRQIYYNWAAAKLELYGRNEELDFAQKKGIRLMPEKIEEIKDIKE